MKTNLALLLPLLFVSAAARTQEMEKRISIHYRAGPVKNLLKEIELQSGFRLGSEPQTANEIIQVMADEQSLAELLPRIAEVTGAQWKKEADCLRLVRPASMQRDQEVRDLTLRSAQIKASLDRFLERSKPDESTAPSTGASKAAGWRLVSPAREALLQILRLVPPEAVAAIAPGSRLVLSTSATRMQKQLSGDTRSILERYVARHNELIGDALNRPISTSVMSLIGFSTFRGPCLSTG